MSKLSEAPALTPPDDDLDDEQPGITPYQISQRVDKMQARINALLKPDNLAQQLYLDRKLTRDAWYEKYADIGFQLLMRTLIQSGVDGDTKAADLGMKYLTQWLDRTRQTKTAAADERVTQVQSELMQRPRAPQPVVSDSTITGQDE